MTKEKGVIGVAVDKVKLEANLVRGNDLYVWVLSCQTCGETKVFQLDTARGGVVTIIAKSQLKLEGWHKDKGGHICPACYAKSKKGEPKENGAAYG